MIIGYLYSVGGLADAIRNQLPKKQRIFNRLFAKVMPKAEKRAAEA